MNVKFIQLTAAKFSAVTYDASKHQGLFVHLTEPVLKGGEGEDKDDVVTPAGLYFGGVSSWEMLTNDTDVAAIDSAIEAALDALKGELSDEDADTLEEINDELDALDEVIGSKGTPAVTHPATEEDVAANNAEQIGDEVVDEPAIPSTGLYKEIEDAITGVNTVIEGLDTAEDVTIATVEDGVVTIKAGIKEEDGLISQGSGTDIILSKVATTGKAEDIIFSQHPSDDDLDGSDEPVIADGATLQEVMESVVEAIAETNADSVIALYDADGNVLTGADAEVKADGTTYTLKQGSGADAAVVAKFNIVKDSFVKSGDVVYGSLSEGVFTPAEAAADGSNAYIHLVVGTADEAVSDMYIAAASLIEYSSVAEGDLYLESNADSHVISVTDKVKDAIAKVEGLTVNGVEVDEDGSVEISASDIVYKEGAAEVSHEATAEEAAAFNEENADAIAAGDVAEMQEGDKIVDTPATDDTTLADAVKSLETAVEALEDGSYAGVVADEDNNSEYVTISTIDEESHTQTLSVKIGSFTVKEIVGEDGNPVIEGAAQVKGLATVEDVEQIIVDNEEVTAAALNDLNTRVEALEDADAVVTTVTGDTAAALEKTGVNVVVKVADAPAEGSNDHAYTVSATAEMVWLTELPA